MKKIKLKGVKTPATDLRGYLTPETVREPIGDIFWLDEYDRVKPKVKKAIGEAAAASFGGHLRLRATLPGFGKTACLWAKRSKKDARRALAATARDYGFTIEKLKLKRNLTR